MSDDYSQRRHRSSDSIARSGQAGGVPSGNDPLAELARLIGQTDPFGDSARIPPPSGAPPAVDWMAPSMQPHQPQLFPAQDVSFPPLADSRRPSSGDPEPAILSDRFGQPPASGQIPPHEQGLYQVEAAVPSYLTQRGPAPVTDAPAYDPARDYRDDHHDVYDDAPAGPRRIGVVAAAALFGLAVVGTAGAFGYRAVFGGSSSHVPPVIKADARPLKIVPKETETKKAMSDRVTDATEKVVPREEKPVDISQRIVAPAAVAMPAVQPPVSVRGNGVLSSEPKKVHTIAIRPDGSEMPQALASPMPPQAPVVTVANASAPVAVPKAATPSAPPLAPARPTVTMREPEPRPVQPVAPHAQASVNAPLSLSPTAAAQPRSVRTANAEPASLAAPAAKPGRATSGGFAVQVSSQRSEAEARAAYRGLESKYSKELGGQPMFVHKVDLGAKGIYYRTMIGPFASASEASQLCSSLKSAGGSCLIQKN